jgi:transcriptional regulator with XRE-family HTH domain
MDPATTDIGTRIQSTREQRGLTRHDVSNTTKLPPGTIAAIEQGAFDRLPGGIYRTAYLRAVAGAVGLDPDPLVREYLATLGPETPAPPPTDTVRLYESSAPSWTAVAIIVAVFAAFWLSARPEPNPVDEPDEGSTPFLHVTAPIDAVARLSPAVAADPLLSRAGGPPMHLELAFSDTCWVSAVADGERLIYRLMDAGESVAIEGDDLITIRVGNAGAVTYTFNGVAGDAIGEEGEPATLRFEKDNTKGTKTRSTS